MSKGVFITLEGTEGSGKSTQLKTIEQYLQQHNRRYIKVREPGGTPIAEEIRNLLKTPRKDDAMCDTTELLLMYAARAQLVNTVIKPAIEQGVDVICDRHDLSTVAYQGGGRGMDLGEIKAISKVVLGDFKPNLTILLDIDPIKGMQRAKARGELDRFEQSKMDFFVRVRNTYLECAKQDPNIIKVVNGDDTLDNVSSHIRKLLDNLYA
ncbi:MAG: dTMP kinase [Succinivibrio sp.]|nr:dTMP kinase [Succinivibrio sp.]MCI6449206.1 dTMP kinase [Succinivibrio sp.]MDY5733557.1 dTMP kinase [Succinivibrio sp.]MDY5904829.1 dTMP kinase [Succinivibrio sp.]HAO92018.1 dTMP kinase [Succinivibrio sp.]